MLRPFLLKSVAFIVAAVLLVVAAAPARAASAEDAWMKKLGGLAVQDGGRVMPLETYADNLAAQVTGRTRWSASSGPEAYAGRTSIQLLCDMMFNSHDLIGKPLFGIENRPFKRKIGLDPEKRFFSATELVNCKGLNDLLAEVEKARQLNGNAPTTREQNQALDVRGAIHRLSLFMDGEPLLIVPQPKGKTFLVAGIRGGDPGTEQVQAAFTNLSKAYTSGGDMNAAVDALVDAINAAGSIDPADLKRVNYELFYNSHKPWLMTAILYGVAIVLFGVSRIAGAVLRKPLVILAILCGVAGIVEHCLGITLRVLILERAPVSNTYEALLWMGLTGILLGGVAQAINRKGWYLFGGLAVAELSVLFSYLVPLESQTNSLPAVLRSNYWLIVHVLTIVASYGVLAVGSLLGHVYLVKEVLMAKTAPSPDERLSHPLVAQLYRALQLGVLLLTAGTILGGVWAADSWGRFWGWDPKETWALISIVVYFIMLHARYVRWLHDFGLAASAVLGFAAIVWTFYGVNYLMASGLHSYGFGNGGGGWVAIWAAAEIAFIAVCKLKHRALLKAATPASEVSPIRAATPRSA